MVYYMPLGCNLAVENSSDLETLVFLHGFGGGSSVYEGDRRSIQPLQRNIAL